VIHKPVKTQGNSYIDQVDYAGSEFDAWRVQFRPLKREFDAKNEKNADLEQILVKIRSEKLKFQTTVVELDYMFDPNTQNKDPVENRLMLKLNEC